jgi:hypothetical protein
MENSNFDADEFRLNPTSVGIQGDWFIDSYYGGTIRNLGPNAISDIERVYDAYLDGVKVNIRLIDSKDYGKVTLVLNLFKIPKLPSDLEDLKYKLPKITYNLKRFLLLAIELNKFGICWLTKITSDLLDQVKSRVKQN